MQLKLSYVKIERQRQISVGVEGGGCKGCCKVASFCFDLRDDKIFGIHILVYVETDKYNYRHKITSKWLLFFACSVVIIRLGDEMKTLKRLSFGEESFDPERVTSIMY